MLTVQMLLNITARTPSIIEANQDNIIYIGVYIDLVEVQYKFY